MQLPFIRENYFIFDTGYTVIPYGCFIISKLPPQYPMLSIYSNFSRQVLIEEFPTKMARKLVKCRFQINGRIFDVGTVHLGKNIFNI